MRVKRCPFTMESDDDVSVRLSMKILSVTGPLHREFGGPPMAVAGACSSLSNIGNQVKVVVCGQSFTDSQINSTLYNQLLSAGVVVCVFRRKKESKYGAFLKINELKSIWKSVGESEFVILHQVFELQHFALFAILKLQKKPYAVMPHGTLTRYQRRKHIFRKFLFSPFTYLFLRNSSSIFVATQQEKNQLPKYLQNRGHVVGLGIIKNLPKSSQKNKKRSTFNLLYMGRITKKKRLDIALQAFMLAKQASNQPMKFIICGTGPENEVNEIRKLARALNCESDVEFRGWVDATEKQLALSESDCFILTSEDENFAIAAAEALSNGIPCILSSNVAVSSLVLEYSAGEVFAKLDPNDIAELILRLSKMDKLALKHNSYEAAERISWDRIAVEWNNQIQTLLSI